MKATDQKLIDSYIHGAGFCAEVAKTCQRTGRMSDKQRAVLQRGPLKRRILWQNWDDVGDYDERELDFWMGLDGW